MKFRLFAWILTAGVLAAQSPNLTGVWKANLEKSKFAGQPPTAYVVIIDQQGTKMTELIGSTNQRGEQRSQLTLNSEKPAMNSYRGLPMRTETSWNGNTLVANSKVAGHPATISEKYTLGADGNTLTIETATTANGKDSLQTIVLDKQPDSAGDALRAPEQTAGAHFKNVLILKDVPASQFIDSMRYFSMALGVECEHCHVQGKFEADDKKEKGMARKMLTMTHDINEKNFNGRMEVRCYTCHKGQADPANRPAF